MRRASGNGPTHGIFAILRLTPAGHDFLDSVRSPEVRKKTKIGAEAAGGFTMDLLKDLARG